MARRDESMPNLLEGRKAMSGVDLEKVENDFLTFAWENLSPRDRAKVMAGSPKTAWIFGAGASHHYVMNARGVPVPLANGFFSAFHQLPTSEGFHAHEKGTLLTELNYSEIEFMYHP